MHPTSKWQKEGIFVNTNNKIIYVLFYFNFSLFSYNISCVTFLISECLRF